MSDADLPQSQPEIARIIVCVDCGGRAHLLTHLDDETPVQPGEWLAYRCEDCLDRWDLEVPEPSDNQPDS